MVDAEAFEVFDVKVFQHLVARRNIGKSPVVEFKNKVFSNEEIVEFSLQSTFHKDFFGRKSREKFVDIFHISFGYKIFSGGNIQQRQSHIGCAEVDGSKEIVFFAGQYVVSQSHTGGHQFGDAAFDKLLGEFRVFELVTNGNAVSCTDEARKIVVERVVRKTGHGNRTRRTFLVTFCEGDAEDLRSHHRIITIRFVEVATTEEENRIGIRRLHVVKLLHHGGECFLRHKCIVIYKDFVPCCDCWSGAKLQKISGLSKCMMRGKSVACWLWVLFDIRL